jgi:hypothetical protein
MLDSGLATVFPVNVQHLNQINKHEIAEEGRGDGWRAEKERGASRCPRLLLSALQE